MQVGLRNFDVVAKDGVELNLKRPNSGPPAFPLLDLRQKLLAKPPTLPVIFQTGDRILAATGDPAAMGWRS